MPRIRTLSLVGDGVQKNGKTVTKAMLASIVKAHSKDARPPITLGHPGKGADKVPALGRVDNPRIEASRRHPGKSELVVELHYTPELEKLEDEGKFEGFSAGIYPTPDGKNYYLHHVASLGELPPAAETETLDLVELSHEGEDAMMVISGTLTFSDDKEDIDMTKEELAASLKDVLAEQMKPLTERLDKLEKGATTAADDTGGDHEKDKDKPVEDTQAREQLKGMQETVKSDRIAQATELANAKGWSTEEFKPLLTMLQKAEPVELCDNSEGALFSTVKATLTARKVQASAPNPLLLPLEFSDNKGNKQEMGLHDLARVTKF
ncbi:hypothetical protein ACW5WQ_19650 [Aeromonas rivuli]|uniref:hypothetical protein n=1 Tax=Aeromonas rivuli TaxID=648794 RepID=UPI0005AB5631|nr:hypothetical protein [Aeromonas rivuli]